MVGFWLVIYIWEYYDYIWDKKFLKEVGYDFIKSSVNFVVDYLWYKLDGIYIVVFLIFFEYGFVD